MKFEYSVVTAALLLSAGAANADVTLPAPIAHYGFDGTINDSSPNEWQTTMHGGTPVYVAGKNGEAITLDGADDFIEVQHNGNLNFEVSAQAFTVSLFVRPSRNDRQQTLIQDRYGANSNISYRIHLDPAGPDEVMSEYWIDRGPLPSAVVYASIDDVVGAWHHIALVSDPVQGKRLLYIDRAAPVTFDFPDYTYTMSTKNARNGLTIGAYDGGGWMGNWFQGEIDDVRIYDQALSSKQVGALVPEPATLGLLALGGLAVVRRRQKA